MNSPEQSTRCANCPRRLWISRVAAKAGLTEAKADCKGPDSIAYYQYTGYAGQVLTAYSHGELVCPTEDVDARVRATGAEVLRILPLASGERLTIAGRAEDGLSSTDMHLAENF